MYVVEGGSECSPAQTLTYNQVLLVGLPLHCLKTLCFLLPRGKALQTLSLNPRIIAAETAHLAESENAEVTSAENVYEGNDPKYSNILKVRG